MFCIEIKILIGILLPVLINFKHWLEVNLMYQADVGSYSQDHFEWSYSVINTCSSYFIKQDYCEATSLCHMRPVLPLHQTEKSFFYRYFDQEILPKSQKFLHNFLHNLCQIKQGFVCEISKQELFRGCSRYWIACVRTLVFPLNKRYKLIPLGISLYLLFSENTNVG